jgi:hypothetical protein
MTNHDFITLETSTEGDTHTGRVYVTYVRWINGTTAGHQLVLKDSHGATLWESVADGANFLDIHPLFRWVDGLDVDTMDSGKVMVWLG